MKKAKKILQLVAVLAVTSALGGCDDMRMYGSVGYSSYGGGGYYGGSGIGTSVTVGGRIF